MGQDRLDAGHGAEEVHVELAVGGFQAGEFHRPGNAEARVADQQIDAALPGKHLFHRRGDGIGLGHIRRDVLYGAAIIGGAAQAVDPVAPAGKQQGRGLADAPDAPVMRRTGLCFSMAFQHPFKNIQCFIQQGFR